VAREFNLRYHFFVRQIHNLQVAIPLSHNYVLLVKVKQFIYLILGSQAGCYLSYLDVINIDLSVSAKVQSVPDHEG
jgi:hypothetical protein